MSRTKRNEAAAHYLSRAPNYSAEAIRDLKEEAAQIKAQYPSASMLMVLFAAILEESHKFVLPDGGRLLGGGVEPAMMETFRLPFDKVALEFDAVNDEDMPHDRFHVRSIPRRIAMCVDVEHLAQRLAGPLTGLNAVDLEPSCLVWPIDYNNGLWTPSWAGALIPYNQEPTPVTPERAMEARTRLAALGAVEGVSARSRETTFRVTFVKLGDLGESICANLGPDESEYAATVDCLEEITAAFQTCAALACANVTTETIRPNREARAARPASTLFDYHVLVIRAGAKHETSGGHGGTHASPRTHLRRGHIRRLAWGPRIWVNSCVVNPSAIGTVNKDYRVRP